MLEVCPNCWTRLALRMLVVQGLALSKDCTRDLPVFAPDGPVTAPEPSVLDRESWASWSRRTCLRISAGTW